MWFNIDVVSVDIVCNLQNEISSFGGTLVLPMRLSNVILKGDGPAKRFHAEKSKNT